ncbi:MAG: haloalkane dehalogenase, partial [Solirubrobacterales bacterium]
MESVRTPDERFANLPGYPFEPRYVEIPDGEGGTLRMHYVEEGPADGEVILLLHGEPTWSYLYRRMIPGLAAAGHRVIAPDLIGFGRSDKVVGRENYSYTRHVSWVEAFIEALDLRGITLFGQDWGSIVGLAVATRMEDRFARIVMANGALADPRRMERMVEVLRDSPMPEALAAWQAFVAAADELDVARVEAGDRLGLLGTALHD